MAEFIEEILEKNRLADEAKSEFDALNAKTKSAKGRWERLVEDVQSTIRDYGKELPLFPTTTIVTETDGTVDVEFTVLRPQLCGPPSNSNVSRKQANPEAWRKVQIDHLEVLGCSEKTVQCLIDAGINSIGDLADWNREYNALTKIPGVGQVKAAEIENAMDRFWEAWNRGDIAA